MRESFVALTTLDRDDLTGVTSVGAWVKRWLNCQGQGMSVLFYVSSQARMPFIPCYHQSEYERAQWYLILKYCGPEFPEISFV